MSNSRRFIAVRDRLLQLRADPQTAQHEFRWPEFEYFNWARDYFDVIAADNEATALRLVDDAGTIGRCRSRHWRAARHSSRRFSTRAGCGPANACC